MVAEREAVIAHQHDDGIVVVPQLPERGEDAFEGGVDAGDLAGIKATEMGDFFCGCPVGGHAPHRQHQAGAGVIRIGVHIELRRRIPRLVRIEGVHPEKDVGMIAIVVEPLDGVVGDLRREPVVGGLEAGGVGEELGHAGAPDVVVMRVDISVEVQVGRMGFPGIVFLAADPFVGVVGAVVVHAGGAIVPGVGDDAADVTVGHEDFRNGDVGVGEGLPGTAHQGPGARHQARASGNSRQSLRIHIVEDDRLLGEAVDVRRSAGGDAIENWLPAIVKTDVILAEGVDHQNDKIHACRLPATYLENSMLGDGVRGWEAVGAQTAGDWLSESGGAPASGSSPAQQER